VRIAPILTFLKEFKLMFVTKGADSGLDDISKGRKMRKVLSISHILLLRFKCSSFKIGNITISTLPLLAAILLIHSKIADKVIQ
jgi:hypothetical protein